MVTVNRNCLVLGMNNLAFFFGKEMDAELGHNIDHELILLIQPWYAFLMTALPSSQFIIMK